METSDHKVHTVMMPMVLRLLRLTGVLGDRRNRYKYMLVFACYWFTILVPKVCFGYPSKEAAMRSFAELVTETNIFVGVLTLHLQPDSFRLLVSDLQSFFSIVVRDDQPKSIQEHFDRVNRRANKFNLLYCLYMSCNCTFYCFGPLVVNYPMFSAAINQNNSTEIDFSLHFEQGFYWLDNRSSPVGYAIFTAIILPVVGVCAYAAVTKMLTVCNMIKCCQTALRTVVLKVEHLDKLPSTDQRIEALREIMEMHQRALQCSELLEIILQPIMLIQFILCIVIWCTIMLFFTICGINEIFINMFILFFFICLETFAYSYLGTRLSQESVNIGVALYGLPWFEFDLRTQRNIEIMLMRAQRRIGLTAAKFAYVDMEHFGAMSQMSYSAFVVLKDAWNNQ